ncbi:sn-glycerol 3-phosphate transport system substrate-binding protein [Clavibacter sp. B3I6]|uniref:ABC transporter substrate-binding protein n=1 Tax=Clavibacter sp. B3I6 TaxID=3042268 RepID=UPI0027884C5C|nr:ABC transporter substrate-binding protein [Clavibacter sp. B3I6]MDQ0744497.1 sn-glycerol 3-phosphate transport system substrate-binding protein [Clavibacter sp. B3I6]
MQYSNEPRPRRWPSVTRRQVLAGGVLAATMPLLASCFGSGGGASGTVYDQPSGDTPPEFEGRQRVVMWSNFVENNGEVLQANIDAFNASQEDIYCEVQTFEGYDVVESKIAASLQARQVPDLSVLSDVVWNRFYLNEMLEPLTSYFDTSFTTAAFHERFIAEGTVQDEVWWVPFGRSTPLFYYNRDVFSAVGLPDRTPETFSEYRDWGKELQGYSSGGTQVRMRAYDGNDDWYFQGSSWAFGGGYSDGLDPRFTSDGTVAALEYDRAFIHDDGSGYLAADPTGDFIAGSAATVFNSTGALTGIQDAAAFEYGCGFLPREVDTGVPTGGSGLSIFRYASDERKKAAWEVLRFLSSGDAAVAWTLGTGYMPTATDAIESPEVKARAAENPNYRIAIDQLDIARFPDTVRRYVPETVPEAKAAIQKVYADGADPAATLKTVQDALRAPIDEVRAKYDQLVG